MTLRHVNSWPERCVAGGWGVLVSCVACALYAMLASPVAAQPTCAPFSAFQAMSPAELQTLQVKLTYVGIQDKGIPSLVFTSNSQVPDVGLFSGVQKPGIDYSNDLFKVNTFTTTTDLLKAMIDGLSGLPAVTGGGVDPDAFFSFSLINPGTGGTCFEAVLSPQASADLFTQLRSSLQTDLVALQRITELGCPLAIVDPARPTDVTSQVAVTFSGLRLNRTTGRFVGIVTLKNNGSADLTGPLSLVINATGNVALANGIGTTCATTPAGIPFLNVALPGNTLAPGATVQATTEFRNPDGGPVTPTSIVLAGPGTR